MLTTRVEGIYRGMEYYDLFPVGYGLFIHNTNNYYRTEIGDSNSSDICGCGSSIPLLNILYDCFLRTKELIMLRRHSRNPDVFGVNRLLNSEIGTKAKRITQSMREHTSLWGEKCIFRRHPTETKCMLLFCVQRL